MKKLIDPLSVKTSHSVSSFYILVYVPSVDTFELRMVAIYNVKEYRKGRQNEENRKTFFVIVAF